MNSKKLALILIVLLSSLSYSQNNPINFQHITAKDGLSQGHILCMIQDRDGYIWAGTYHGVNRYNGYNIDVITSEPNNPNSLQVNAVFSLFEDRDGLIWMGTWGIDIYNKKNGTFSHINADDGVFRADQKNKTVSYGEIPAITQDRNGNMWIGTRGGGLNKIDYLTKKITYYKSAYKSDQSLNSNYVNDLLIDKNNNLWIATEGGGLSVMDLMDYSINTYKHSIEDINSLASNNIVSLYEDPDGKIWLGDDIGNLLKFDNIKNNFITYDVLPEKFNEKQIRIMAIKKDWEGNFLLATNGAGLVIFNEKSNSTKLNLHQSNLASSISSNELRSLLVDKNNTVFVGSYGRGISKYSLYNRKFEIHKVEIPGIDNSSLNSFTSAIEDEYGSMITGTYSGFLVFDKNDWSYKHYLPGKSYEENKVLTIKQAPDKTIWISSVKKLYRYDQNFNKIASYVFDIAKSDHSIYALEFDRYNNLWLSFLHAGLIKIEESEWSDLSKKEFKYKIYKADNNDSTSIPGDQTWELLNDENSNLWLGNVQGLSRYNFEQDNFTTFFNPATIKSFKIDKKGIFWLATDGEGLFSYNAKNGKNKKYSKSEGLGNSFLYGLIIDDNENIWLTSESGLSKLNIENEEFKNYDINDGLPNDHFDDNSVLQLSDGRIYMGTINGFIIFNPDQIIEDTTKSKIVLTSITINNEKPQRYSHIFGDTVQNVPIDQIDKIELSPNEKDFTLEFAALCYSSPHKIKYSYKLEGYDNNWTLTDSKNRIVRYTNLDEGEYTFQVKSTNTDGKWIQKPLNIKIIVNPPFYKTRWFILLSIVSILVIIILYFRRRISYEVNQKKILSEKVEERTLEISKKNRLLEDRAEEEHALNIQLEEQKNEIEKQSRKLESKKNELESINETKDKLFSIIAHDLKNPFHVIMGYCDLLIDQYNSWDDEKKLQFLNLLRDSTKSAYNLLENLLHWSRSQMGSVTFNPIPKNVDDIVKVVISEIKAFATKKEIEIIYESNKNNLIVNADVDMLSLVLRNLISNAIKFSKKGSKIFITTSEENSDNVKFTIGDEGVGINNEDLNNLFNLNKSKSIVGTSGEKGTGLGLILCKEFISNHHGKIWVESEVNNGTTFYFTIPSAH